jgi:hypothetical protein
MLSTGAGIGVGMNKSCAVKPSELREAVKALRELKTFAAAEESVWEPYADPYRQEPTANAAKAKGKTTGDWEPYEDPYALT